MNPCDQVLAFLDSDQVKHVTHVLDHVLIVTI